MNLFEDNKQKYPAYEVDGDIFIRKIVELLGYEYKEIFVGEMGNDAYLPINTEDKNNFYNPDEYYEDFINDLKDDSVNCIELSSNNVLITAAKILANEGKIPHGYYVLEINH